MGGPPSRTLLLILAVLLFAVLATAALTQLAALIVVAVLVTTIILWLEGYVRFPRFRRFVRSIGQGLWAFIRTRHMSKRQLRNIGVVLGVGVLVVVFNQLKLKMPGQGRGLSVPTEALSLNFGGINSPGEWIATTIAYGIIVTLLGLGWYRLWQEVKLAGETWRRRAFFACVVSFFVFPILFAILMATVAPEDPEANVEYSKVLLGVVGVGMAAAFCTAIVLPLFGKTRPRPAASPPPQAAAATPPISFTSAVPARRGRP